MKKPFMLAAVIHLTLASCGGVLAELPTQVAVGEINDLPLKQIKHIISRTYDLYQREHDLPKNFSIMVSFNLDGNGAIQQSTIRLIKSSTSQVIDRKALEVLEHVSESHLFGILSDLTSDIVQFELGETTLRVVITGFAQSESVAKAKSEMLGKFVSVLRSSRKDAIIAEFLNSVRIKTDNKRVDIELVMPRGRANEIMLKWMDDKER